ncbi:MAG TPA: DNA lyase [Candidatus Woesearchaeota archaeon]|nr:DNA lyase [Candidatus Woesearchaeota archaeon]
MRLWSIHPKYLDKAGIVAVWREGLLAKKVLENKTTGYRSHPQLVRFRNLPEPILSINAYLTYILEEAKARGYCFDQAKIKKSLLKKQIAVTSGQLDYELSHLLKKLSKRDPEKLINLKAISQPEPHPLFRPVPGEIESWEKL